MAKVVLEDISFKFENKLCVDRINLEIEDKKCTVLLGPSGCGKTLILRMIAGLTRPTEGKIYIGDRLINDLDPADRGIAMMFQNYALFPQLTVFDNIAFPLKAVKMPKAEIKQRVEEVAHFLHIEEFLHRYPTALSGGQQQRVALGRTLVKRPLVFLLDEPLANLDAKLRVEMRSHLKRIQQMLKITLLYVTNDQTDAQAIADKIAIMKEGTIEQVGSPEEVYESPANTFVARFLGTPPINFAEGTVKKKEGKLYLDTGVFTIPVSEMVMKRRLDKLIQKELIIGVRPECIKLAEEKEDMSFPAIVYFSQVQNSDVLIDLKIGDLIWRMKEQLDQVSSLPGEGEKVWLKLTQEKLLFFDKSTGKRIAA